MRLVFLLLTALLAGREPQTGDALVRAMHDRYDGQWYRTLTFVQHNTLYLPGDSVQHSTWFERATIPGTLRIDFRDGPGFPPDGGVLFARDTQFVIQGDSLVRADPFVHPLMVLGFDVYALPVEQTLGKLRQLGFDLATTHEDTWQGRPVVVVGAKAGDLHTRQFWVDKERLVFVRMLEPAPRDSTKTAETRFNKYAPLAGGWVSAEVEFLVDGRQQFLEEYTQIQTDAAMPAALWDPRQWKAARAGR
ncbi:MAG TPA: hypothetical protein VIV10_06505 [Gemmatimonadales bacterium]